MIAKIKRSLWVGIVSILTLGTFLSPMAYATEGQGKGDTDTWVFVCKYVGKPGVDEHLKDGKQPIRVKSSATVGEWFKDAQGRSFVLDVSTEANTGQGNEYTGNKTCPVTETKDAVVTWAVSDPTCEAGAKLTHSAVNATLNAGSTPSGTYGPLLLFGFTYTADPGHLFGNGANTEHHQGMLLGMIPSQSTNPEGRCFVPPALEPTVTHSRWVDGTIVCGATTVDQTRTTTTVSHTWVKVDGVWRIENGTPVVTVEHRTRTLNEEEIKVCPPTSIVITAEVAIKDATCTTGQTLMYDVASHTTVSATSTKSGAAGTGTGTAYNVTFLAASGYAFRNSQNQLVGEMVFSGTLAGPSTAPSCEQGSVLGSTTTTPSGGAGAATVVLPHTSGEAGTVVIFGGSLLAIVLAVAGARRFLARGL